MAINPNEVSIINIPELDDVTTIQDSDLVIIGQGITAKITTISKLKQAFGVDAITEVATLVDELEFAVVDLQNEPKLLFTEQPLTESQRQIARDNVEVYSTEQTSTLVNNAKVVMEISGDDLILVDGLGNTVSSIPMTEFNSTPKQKQIYTRQLEETDLLDPSEINLELASVPDQDEWYDLHINGGFVSDNSYEITEDTLSIIKSEISEVSIGDKVIFRYREL